jgi:hypothetical protein
MVTPSVFRDGVPGAAAIQPDAQLRQDQRFGNITKNWYDYQKEVGANRS